jgi:hypothetical protein
MSRLQLTVALTGKCGPYTVLTDSALEGLKERMTSAVLPAIPVIRSDGKITVGTLDVDSVEIVELTPGQKAIRAYVEIDMPEPEPPARTSGFDAIKHELDGVMGKTVVD